jgi:hypothetical protein
MASEQMGFDRAELRQVYAALKAMGDAAKEEAKRDSNALAEYAQKQISVAATTRGKAANKIATGSKVKKSSTTGEITYGYASQKFSGGAILRCSGVVTNSDQTDIASSLFGQAVKVEDLKAGLSIQRFVRFSLTSWINGQNHLIKFLRGGHNGTSIKSLNAQVTRRYIRLY